MTVSRTDPKTTETIGHQFFDKIVYANAVEARHHAAVFALHHVNWQKVIRLYGIAGCEH